MKLSISNIAWDSNFETQVINLLLENEITNLDFAPGKFFHDLASAKDSDILKVKKEWEIKGFALSGIQSLLFGTSGLNLFDVSTQNRMLQHLEKVCHIGSLTGATRLVFGSPKNRDRSSLNDSQTKEIALDFFYRLGEIARKEKVDVCLEANPSIYGTNFLTTTEDAATFVRILNHPNIKLQLDLGTVYTNHEDISIFDEITDIIGHIHLSEPSMAPIITDDPAHRETGEKIKKIYSRLSTDVITIEMLTDNTDLTENRLNKIKEAVRVAKSIYMPS